MSFLDTNDAAPSTGFAHGWTAFLTNEGLDILLRTAAGESKGRLSQLDKDGNLVGSMYEPSDYNEDPAILELSVTIHSEDAFSLRCGKRAWTLRRPQGKSHYFAFLQQWPSKAEAVGSAKDMLAALKKRKS